MSLYNWTITKAPIEPSEAGTTGPRDATMNHAEIVKHPNGKPFRMLDDDGEVYYHGIIVIDEQCTDPEAEFYPLDDFGRPNAGCTIIQYRNGRTWEDL